MYDTSQKLLKFYDDHVRLGTELRKKLAEHRDACLSRLQDGLAKLAEEGKKAGKYERQVGQGSYVMHTLNQQRDDDYDLDVGVIFKKESLPETALDARKRVLEALERAGGNFSKPPEARLNAVTVYYAEGHHIDIAVYRENSSGIEHASADWTKREPEEVTAWFLKQVKDREPEGSKREDGQLRRLVRYLKAFARSRSSWSLPGGMIMTTLVCEVAVVDAERDDQALYNTFVALRDRLKQSTEVVSPVDPASKLTAKPEYEAQVCRLKDRLTEALDKLAILHNSGCTEAEAMKAWNWIFRHEYWGEAQEKAVESVEPGSLSIEIGVASTKGGRPYQTYFPTSPALQKNLWLRFRLKDRNGLEGASIKWLVENTGDEAEAANHLTHSTQRPVGDDHWESTLYKGTHTMICEAYRNEILIAKGRRRVRIGSR